MSQQVTARPAASPSRWPGLALIAGGSLIVALWPVYTSLHGPGSIDQNGSLLGEGTEFWGAMMEGPPVLLIALGLAGAYKLLTGQAGRMARVGFVLTMIALVLPALVNLVILAVMPPLLSPLLAVGLFLLATDNRANPSLPRSSRNMLIGLAMLQLFAFLWTLFVRPDLMEQIDGYRIYGVGANVLYGIGWIVLGTILVTRARTPEPGEVAFAVAANS